MEEWKDYIYNYQVSNFGRIKNKKTNKILKIHNNKNGYATICVTLGHRGKNKLIRIHRAVAISFIPNPENKPQVNHIDGNKLNNNINNLEWTTASENMRHAVKTGLHKALKGCNNYVSKLTEDEVKYIRNNYIPRHKVYGCRALAKKYNISHSAISRILSNKRY